MPEIPKKALEAQIGVVRFLWEKYGPLNPREIVRVLSIDYDQAVGILRLLGNQREISNNDGRWGPKREPERMFL